MIKSIRVLYRGDFTLIFLEEPIKVHRAYLNKGHYIKTDEGRWYNLNLPYVELTRMKYLAERALLDALLLDHDEKEP